jgi:hypothetical protein
MTYWQWLWFFLTFGNGPIASLIKASRIGKPQWHLTVRLGPRWWQHWIFETVVIVLFLAVFWFVAAAIAVLP